MVSERDMKEKLFTAKGKIFQDPVGERTWIEIEGEGLQLSIGFKGKGRLLDKYYLKTEDFTDYKYFLSGEWTDIHRKRLVPSI